MVVDLFSGNMIKRNQDIVAIFKEMSLMYQYLGAEERFRSLAYQKAARIIAGLPQDIEQYIKNNSLDELPGIGESISEKIKEYISSGKIKTHEQLKKKVPLELLEMMDVKGFGPRSLEKIHRELKIDTKAALINALQNGSIEKLKGFGGKKVEGMLKSLKLHKTIEDRMLLWDALEIGNEILKQLKELKFVKQAELAGSLRRAKETIGDIDILVSCEEKDRKKIVDYFTKPDFTQQVLAKGDTKASIILKDKKKQVDLRIVNEDEWGAALQYFTGSKEHNIHLRTLAKENSYKINEYGIFTESGKKIAGKSEEEIYKTLGLQLMPPEMREDKGEIELAAKKKIPQLISLADIKGDLQMHSVWSDGVSSIEDISTYVNKNFPYEYIVITDHSKSSRIANGMDEKQILKQIKAIKELNQKTGNAFIKAGIEVDILANGELDISNEILSQLDWVTAAIHSGFNMDNTGRLLRACENPHVCCIAHPTGRLIGKREAYKINLDEVISAAKLTHTALEINAQPERMDLNDEMTKQAKEKGVKLIISTDSHSLEQFSYMPLGVFIARRAWCTAEDILNTKSWKEVVKFKNEKIK